MFNIPFFIQVTSIVSLSAALYNTRTNQQNLRDTIVSSEAVSVFRPAAGAEAVNPSDVNPSTMQVNHELYCTTLF